MEASSSSKHKKFDFSLTEGSSKKARRAFESSFSSLTEINFQDVIPEELILKIFYQLPSYSLKECKLTCRNWYRIANDKYLNINKKCKYNFRQNLSTDSELITMLNFDGNKEIFTHHSLMIGVFHERIPYCSDKLHLIAFDMRTEELVWEISLPEDFNLQQFEELIALKSTDGKKIDFINPNTGKIHSMVNVPEAGDRDNNFHVASGFAYQVISIDHPGRIIHGGQIVDHQWISKFTSKTPGGSCIFYSTHCGFPQDFIDELILFSPTGDQVTLQNCITSIARGDKLFSIEKDYNNKDKCFLTIRTLKTDSEVISEIEKSISIDVMNVSFGNIFFGKVCQNGQVILFSRNIHGDKKPIFVDIETQKINHSAYKLSYNTKSFITDSADLWIWEESSKTIFKVNSEEVLLMGQQVRIPGGSLVHVDKNTLYFSNKFCFEHV